MSEKIKGINVKESVWDRLRNLSYDNRMSIPQFIVKLMDVWDEKDKGNIK